MPLLIDGYNLLHASDVFGRGGRTSLHGSRTALLDFLASRLDLRGEGSVTIVFDSREAPPGLPRQFTHRGIQVHFAPRGAEADDLLEELIRQNHTPRRLTVVSSDHRVQRAARRRHAQPVDSEVWWVRLKQTPPADPVPGPPPNPRESPPQPPEVGDLMAEAERLLQAELGSLPGNELPNAFDPQWLARLPAPDKDEDLFRD